MEITSLVWCGAILSVTILTWRSVLNYLLGFNIDPNEPPLIEPAIPYIGHAIGLWWRKFEYYDELRSKTKDAPIFTMPLLGKKLYIVNHPSLLRDIQRQHKDISFLPFQLKFARRLLGMSSETQKVMSRDSDPTCDEKGGLVQGQHAIFKEELSSGERLEKITLVMLNKLEEQLDGLAIGSDRMTGNRMLLYTTLKSIVTIATTFATYGPRNPLESGEVQSAFWEFVKGLTGILVGFPFSRNGIGAREKVVTAFNEYFKSGAYEGGPALVRDRFKIFRTHKIPVEDSARFEVGILMAFLVNITPSVFWLLFFIYSDKNLLVEIRRELDAVVEKTCDIDDNIVHVLDLTKVKDECPLLASTFQETLRHRAVDISTRQIMNDVILDGKWLLKKDAIIQTPARGIHMDQPTWGSDAQDFNPRRFLKDTMPKIANGKKPGGNAFRAFGGGTTLCPGKQFGTNEILALVSMIIVRFEVVPVVGSWKISRTDNTNVAAVISEPDKDIQVTFSLREEGFDDGYWRFSSSN